MYNTRSSESSFYPTSKVGKKDKRAKANSALSHPAKRHAARKSAVDGGGQPPGLASLSVALTLVVTRHHVLCGTSRGELLVLDRQDFHPVLTRALFSLTAGLSAEEKTAAVSYLVLNPSSTGFLCLSQGPRDTRLCLGE